jgi:hypothetical protein
MSINLKSLIKRAKEYVELEANTEVRSVRFVEKFRLFGRTDVALYVKTKDRKYPEWWVIGGSTPMNLYSKKDFSSADTAFSMHTGLMLRMSARDFEHNAIKPSYIGYDAFISHASEDKNKIVRPLAQRLGKMGFSIWYDEYELKVGDSLRQSIDRGLVNSRYGIVILSKAFFKKKWPQYELNGLSAREIDGNKVILPVWYNISKKEILRYSPTLADKMAAVIKDNDISKAVKELSKALKEI